MELQAIQNKIYEIRGHRVMLDFDLAELYQVQTKALKQAVKRNILRFPDDFMFQLTKEEWSELVTNCDRLPATIKHSSVIPVAFTQEGVASLSGVLRSEVAINVYISIMRAFVAMREFILARASESAELAQLRERVLKLEHATYRLEQAAEDNLEATNDLSEDTRKHLDNLYNAIGELSVKPSQIDKPRKRIGYKTGDE